MRELPKDPLERANFLFGEMCLDRLDGGKRLERYRHIMRASGDAASGPGSHASHHAALGVDGPSGFDPYRKEEEK